MSRGGGPAEARGPLGTLTQMPTRPHDRDGLPIVAARHVSKTFTVPEERVHTLKERALHPRRRSRRRAFVALDDVSFAVAAGEFFGIAGRNGSGKSTLLKCLAGIYRADGEIWCRGRISTLIELGVGFNLDLPARDNVIMNGIMLGLTPREARRRFESVMEFAELQQFKDLKLKNYSSGMHVRLAFSVAIQVDADILMIDEVLAVGDAAFQQKCFDVFNELRDAGKTIIFVTHDMGVMQRFCHRALLLERGRPVYLGDTHEVAERYLELNFGREASGETSSRAGEGQARVLEVWLQDDSGTRLTNAPQHRRVTLGARIVFHEEVVDPAVTMYVLNEDHRTIMVASTGTDHEHSGRFGAGEQVVFSFSFDNVLAPGRYFPVFDIFRHGVGVDLIDRFGGSFSFVVTGPGALGGVVDLPAQCRIDRLSSAVEDRVRV